MYDIQIVINGVTLRMNHDAGYDIATIGGLTGTSARLNTVQSNTGIGEMYTNGTVGGISLPVRGKILDGQTDKKQSLIDTVVPLGQGQLTLYTKSTSTGREIPYRSIEVVVKETPTITQEYHSKFTFTLYAPKPVWRAATAEGIILQGHAGNAMEVKVNGQVAADFSMRASVTSGKLKDFTLYADYPNAIYGKWLYIDFRKFNADGVSPGAEIDMKRTNGKLRLTIDGVNANQCIWSQSGLDRLDVGTNSMLLRTDADASAKLEYYPSYVGVVYDGV